MEIKKGFSTKIDERFSLHIAENDDTQEFQQILELNVKVHGEPVREYLRRIYLAHPKGYDIYFFYVKNDEIDLIVSGLVLMPLEWSIGGNTFSVCEMGFVGTLEEYRGKGFIRKLNEIYEKVMTERGILMSVIRGIPYYYRKLNYGFAIPLDNRILLSTSKIPTTNLDHLRIRKATYKDIEFIETLYNKYYKNFFIYNKFNKEEFLFRFFNDEFNEFKLTTNIIEVDGKSEAFFSLGMSYDNTAYTIVVSHLSYEQMIKVLQYVKKINIFPKDNDIDFHVYEYTEFGKKIIALGGNHYQDYCWQVRIPDLKKFLEKIKVILENRIAESDFKGLNYDLIISTYEEEFLISFKDGIIIAIDMKRGYPDEKLCDLRIPDSFLYKLLLGDKSFDEIQYIIKNSMVKKESKKLIDILFPKQILLPDTYY